MHSHFFARALLAGTFMLSVTANANMLGYSFDNPQGEARTLSAGDIYSNAAGSLTFSLAAGIDRKVRLSIFPAGNLNSALHQQTSSLLGPNDRIVFDGRSYYGAELTIPALAEGRYVVRSEILSSSDAQVSYVDQDLVIDRTPPTFGDFTWSMPYGGGIAPDGKPAFSNTQARHITLNNVEDSLSGISKAIYRSIYASGPNDGELFREGALNYFSDSNRVSLGSGSNNSGAQLAVPPSTFGQQSLEYHLTDKAGNTSVATLDFHVNSRCNIPPELVAVEDPTFSGAYLGENVFSGFRPVSGPTPINVNPISAIYRVPLSEYRLTEEGRIHGSTTVSISAQHMIHNDGEYGYLRVTGPVDLSGMISAPSARWTNYATWKCNNMVLPNPQFNDSTLPPRIVSVQPYIEGYGWASHNFGFRNDAPRDTYITRYRLTVEERSYPQHAVLYGGRCEVPAGETVCEANINLDFNHTGTANHYHTSMTVHNSDFSGILSRRTFTWEWDAADPYIEDLIEHSAQSKTVVFKGVEPFSNRTWNRVRFHSAGLYARNSAGDEINLPSSSVETQGNDNYVTVSYANLPDGEWELTAWIKDNHLNEGTKTLLTVINDNTPPEISITVPGDTLETLDDITLSVTDNLAERPVITEVNLTEGPGSENVFLVAREIADNQYRLEYPVMFPSLEAGTTYTLSVKARDDQGNIGSSQMQFHFDPPQVEAELAEGGVINIPALPRVFSHSDGQNAVVSAPLTLAGEPVSGSYDVTATLRGDSHMPLMINGVLVNPGDTTVIAPDYNFGIHGGRLDFPVSVVEHGQTGTAHLLLTTTAPNSPVMVTSVKSWMPEVRFNKPEDGIIPALQRATVLALAGAGQCSLTGNLTNSSTQRQPLTSPTCYLEWTDLPPEFYEQNGTNGRSVTGYAIDDNELSIGYRVSVVDRTGATHQMTEGVVQVPVLPASQALQLNTRFLNDSVERFIEHVDFRLENTTLPECHLTTDVDHAITESAAGRLACLVTFTSIPDGLSLIESNGRFNFRGHIEMAEASDAILGWELSAFSPVGTQVNFGADAIAIELVDPQKPDIQINSRNLIEDNLYEMSGEGGLLADVTVTSRPAPLVVQILRSGEVVREDALENFGSNSIRHLMRINADPAPTWSITDYQVRAFYRDMPHVISEPVMRALSVPDTMLRPYAEPDSHQALSTEALPVVAGIHHPFNNNAEYNKHTMGDWEIRLVNMITYNNREPITDFSDIDANGKAHFLIDVSELDTPAFRLIAEARLKSPVPEYQRTELSPRPTFITVLRGNEIDSVIESRRLAGRAPFRLSASLDLENRLDYNAIGEVIWEERKEDGPWEVVDSSGRAIDRLMREYSAGQYAIRATVHNKYSGAEFTTEEIHVHAFDAPSVTIDGPQNAFVGSTATFNADIKHNRNPLSPEEVVVEWSEDGGDNWIPGSAQYQVSRDDIERVPLNVRARLATSPADMDESWTEVRGRIGFGRIAPPRMSIAGPRVIETRRESEWVGTTSAPMRDMDVEINSRFISPDGTVFEGDMVTYQPTAEDLDNGFINLTYQAWVEGYKDNGGFAEMERRVRIWQYDWPTWGFHTRQTAAQAPAEITMRVRNPSGSSRYIEGLVVAWEAPEGVEVIEDRFSDSRVFSISQPGDYPIRAVITDERGNHTELSTVVSLAEQAPWVADFSFNESNDFRRAPLELSFRPNVSGGHPRDRITGYSYLKNGEVADSGRRYGSIVLEEGEHSVGLQIETEFGHQVRMERTIAVAENQPPSCTVDARETFSGYRFQADCEDPDGIVVSHEWRVNDELVGIRGSRISIIIRDEAVPEVSVVGIDDSGARSEPAHWSH